jgi:hypothetical protein
MVCPVPAAHGHTRATVRFCSGGIRTEAHRYSRPIYPRDGKLQQMRHPTAANGASIQNVRRQHALSVPLHVHKWTTRKLPSKSRWVAAKSRFLL